MKDFFEIVRTMCILLEKEKKFIFDEKCMQAFAFVKNKLIEALIFNSPNWEIRFELMCDASDVSIGEVLGNKKENGVHSIYYAIKTLDVTQANCTFTEKEILALVYAFDKFRSYLIATKVVVYIDHAAIRYFQQEICKAPID